MVDDENDPSRGSRTQRHLHPPYGTLGEPRWRRTDSVTGEHRRDTICVSGRSEGSQRTIKYSVWEEKRGKSRKISE